MALVDNQQLETEMPYPWYEEVDMKTPLSQGDIIFNFPVPSILYNEEKYPFFKAVAAEYPAVIVMTQACDLEQGKVNEISLCAIEPLEEIIKAVMLDEAVKSLISCGTAEDEINKDELIDFSDLKGKKKEKPGKIINELKKGQIINFHLLNQNTPSTNNTSIELGFMVAILKKSYQLPIKSAQSIIESGELGTDKRLRLLPPYREHLAQAYANTYSRIGLPIDIKTNVAEPYVKEKFTVKET